MYVVVVWTADGDQWFWMWEEQVPTKRRGEVYCYAIRNWGKKIGMTFTALIVKL